MKPSKTIEMYNLIFFTNILRLLNEHGLTKNDLSKMTGVSTSFLSDLTNGKANPSLNTMAAIAEALRTPLPALLEINDLTDAELAKLDYNDLYLGTPPGFKRISAILPEHQAFIVKKWADSLSKKFKKFI